MGASKKVDKLEQLDTKKTAAMRRDCDKIGRGPHPGTLSAEEEGEGH